MVLIRGHHVEMVVGLDNVIETGDAKTPVIFAPKRLSRSRAAWSLYPAAMSSGQSTSFLAMVAGWAGECLSNAEPLYN